MNTNHIDNSASERAMRYALALLSVVAMLVVATIALLVWANVSFGAFWIGLAAIVLLAALGVVQARQHRRART